MRKNVIAGVIFFTLILVSKPLFSIELMSSADAFETGSWQLSFYGQSVEKEPVVKISGVNSIQIQTSGGSEQVFSRVNTELNMESEYETVIAALTLRPKDGLHYQIKMGQLRNYTIQYSSGSLTNSFRSGNDGLIWGVGARWNATQGTIVSAAAALDISYTQSIVKFDRFESGTSVYTTNQRFEQDEIQIALNVSRRWNKIEPYGGLKVNRVITRMKDEITKQRVRGSKDGVAPFIGLSYEIFEKERIVVEASFIEEKSISAGMSIRF